MSYIEGFVAAVPTANRDAFAAHAGRASPLFRSFGASRVVDAWGDDVPDGKINDFKGAVQARGDETVCFGWMEYPDKATRDAASARMMSDPRMQEIGDMPFDGKRMIFGGFEPIVDAGSASNASTYVDGFIVPVPHGNRDAYKALATRATEVFLDHGATRVVEAWGDDVPAGQVTDYRRAAHATDDEAVVFAFIEWPDKATRDSGMQATMTDPRMKDAPSDMPFDGRRMVYGGFKHI